MEYCWNCHDKYSTSLAESTLYVYSWYAEEIKRKKYSELAKDNHFIPIAQETFGSWGPSGLELLKDIGTRTIIASGNKRARANLFQNISMAMIRGNIINVKSTLPPLNKNQEFLFLN